MNTTALKEPITDQSNRPLRRFAFVFAAIVIFPLCCMGIQLLSEVSNKLNHLVIPIPVELMTVGEPAASPPSETEPINPEFVSFARHFGRSIYLFTIFLIPASQLSLFLMPIALTLAQVARTRFRSCAGNDLGLAFFAVAFSMLAPFPAIWLYFAVSCRLSMVCP